MPPIEIRPFRRSDRDRLTDPVNAHVEAVLPGVTVPPNAVLSQLEHEPGEAVVDPWVAHRDAGDARSRAPPAVGSWSSLLGVPRYVVLLRGINVGSAKRVAMADLRALLEEMGYTAVRTHLNSGNVVLTGPSAPVGRIEKAITARTGLDVRCVVLTAKELRAIIDAHPFIDVVTNGSRMMAHVLGAEPDPDKLADAIKLDPDNARPGPRVIYQWCPDGLLKAPPVTDKLGVLVTARNWNTIAKLDALLSA